MDCIFCKIVNGEIPSYTIYEDDIIKVFMDANPTTDGHCLIIPKKHFKDIEDIDEETLHYILKKAKDIKKLLEEKLNLKGLTFCQNNGISQAVKHYHLHLIPNYDNFYLADHIEDKAKGNIEEVYKKIMD